MEIAYLQEMCRHIRVYVRVLFRGFIILSLTKKHGGGKKKSHRRIVGVIYRDRW